jgi:hypothetical protein
MSLERKDIRAKLDPDGNGYFIDGRLRATSLPPPPPTMRVKCEKTRAAVDAARSARFEHGQSGAAR